MIWQDVKHSTQIKRAGFDPEKKELHIEFMRGATYIYSKVHNDVYLGLVTAQSAGKYFNEVIKGKYEYKKADAEN